MEIKDIIAAADTTSNPWVGRLSNFTTEAILTFGTRQAAGLVQGQLENAGAKAKTTKSPYGEWIVTACWLNV